MRLILKSIIVGVIAAGLLGLVTYGIACFISFLESKGDIYPLAFLLGMVSVFCAAVYYFINK